MPTERVLPLLLATLALLACSRTTAAPLPDVPPGGAEAWLVTVGPGKVYWERFGHNAIWLREPSAGLDHTFNFGFFDFDQKNFFLRFLRGRMLYFAVALPAAREFEFYRHENRDVRLQKLALSPAQYRRLRDGLLNEIKPENRTYRYDYYRNNCSTRVRDALDDALGGELRAATAERPARLDYRDQTRRLTQMDYWYYLGLELALGYPVDRPVSRWDEMFIPMVLADEIATLPAAGGRAGRPLVSSDTMLTVSTRPAAPARPAEVWYRYLALGLLVVALGWTSARFMPPVWPAGLCNAWLLIAGSGGLVLAGLWLLTDHEVARMNANLLFLNPLLLLALVPAGRRLGAVLLAGGVAVGAVLLLLPVHQYNADVAALLAPVNLAVAAWLRKGR
ncbi:MAG: DUF4105 domain-containing protein [Lysobacterales bacterium]|jgi:hypothetical protein